MYSRNADTRRFTVLTTGSILIKFVAPVRPLKRFQTSNVLILQSFGW